MSRKQTVSPPISYRNTTRLTLATSDRAPTSQTNKPACLNGTVSPDAYSIEDLKNFVRVKSARRPTTGQGSVR